MEEEPPANELTRPPDDRDLAVLARELKYLHYEDPALIQLRGKSAEVVVFVSYRAFV